jgi:ATP-dependent DNA helicase RecG
MGLAFKRLERVLELEAEQGYQNKAVVGGIRQFAQFWVGQAREEAADEADRALVEQVAEVLMDYGRLPGAAARSKAVGSLLESLKRRESRMADRAPAPSPAQPGPARQPPPRPAETAVSAPSPARAAKAPARPTPAPARAAPTRPVPAPAKKAARPEPVVPVAPDPVGLSQPVTTIKGVGPKLAEKIARLGAETVWQLLYIFPRRYDDYSLMKPINRLVYGETVTIIGTIWETRVRRGRTPQQSTTHAIISDGTGTIQATWFNQPWLAEQLQAGMQIVLSGTVDQFLGRLAFNSPEWESLELEPLRTRRIVPVYPLTQGLNGNKMRDVMRTAVQQWANRLPDPLPEALRRRQRLYPLHQAVRQIHFPDNQDSLRQAHRRIVFDELFLLQLGMQGQRHRWQSQPGIPLSVDAETLAQFQDALAFTLTGAQQRVIEEITADMARPVPMNRLLQGDVGSGKTVVAAAAMFVAAKAGAQAALMAPTEILAEQHYRSLHRLLEPLDVTVCLLTGSTPAAEKERIYGGLASGEIQVAIGTHALIQEAVSFNRLALAIIDEQHRFGVEQRGALRSKGATTENGRPNPHLLVMSATPIPRTLALSLYGDLDLSIVDEMPPGRQEIKTRWLPSTQRERAYAFIRRQVEQGRQAYIIYPLVEESDKVDAPAAVDEHERLQRVFPNLKLGLVHGRLRADEKEAAMRAFSSGETDVLVATSVIEVGVDVPNSTVIVIEGANRFGLAQLHQFRGRVGRGEHQSYCLLITDSESAEAEERLRALEQTNDGFVLAEKDLEIRGPGQFFGRQQSGIPELQLAGFLNMELLEVAREEAAALFASDPFLERPEHQLLQERVATFWAQAGDVS